MKHRRVTAASFAAVLSPLAGIAASLAGALPAPGGDVPFTEHVISTTADFAFSVFATDMDGDGDADVLSASADDNKIAWYEMRRGSVNRSLGSVLSAKGTVNNTLPFTLADRHATPRLDRAAQLMSGGAMRAMPEPKARACLLLPDEHGRAPLGHGTQSVRIRQCTCDVPIVPDHTWLSGRLPAVGWFDVRRVRCVREWRKHAYQ